MSVPRALVAGALALCVCSFPKVGSAADPAPAETPDALQLTWTSPPGCPATAEVRDRVNTLLAPRTSREFATPLSASGVVTEAPPGTFQLALETYQDGQRFTRSMQAASCVELADAAALVLALALDPTLAQRRSLASPSGAPIETKPPTPNPSSAPAPVPTPPANPPPASEPAPPPAAAVAPEPAPLSPHWHLSAAATLDLGSSSEVAFGPAASVAYSTRSLELALDALWLPPRRTSLPAEPNQGGDLQLFALGARGCYVPLRRAFTAGGCAAFEAGQLSGRGFGTANDARRATWWAAAGPAVFGRYFVAGPFGLLARAELLFPLQDIEFTLENIGVAYHVPALVSRFVLGAEAHFD